MIIIKEEQKMNEIKVTEENLKSIFSTLEDLERTCWEIQADSNRIQETIGKIFKFLLSHHFIKGDHLLIKIK